MSSTTELLAPAETVTPFPGGFGATATHDLRLPLSVEDKRAIADAFREHLFILFPNADLTLDQLHNFTLSLGRADDGKGHLASGADGYTGIRVVENVVKGIYGPKSNSELFWHADRFFDPVAAGILNSIIVPETGGDTSFADMYKALEAMPATLRAEIEGRSIKQDCIVAADGSLGIRAGEEAVDDVTTSPGVEVGIIQRHPMSGRDYLYLGNRQNAYIPGLPIAESEDLLDRLFTHIDNPDFHYRHAWKPHELVLFDNRSCMHRREAFPADADRKLYAAVVVSSTLI